MSVFKETQRQFAYPTSFCNEKKIINFKKFNLGHFIQWAPIRLSFERCSVVTDVLFFTHD